MQTDFLLAEDAGRGGSGLVRGSIVEGFSTLISKSFRIRGRVTNSGVRRLKQNGMQLVEQYLPAGM